MPQQNEARPEDAVPSTAWLCLEVIREITRRANDGKKIVIESDWGGNTLTIWDETAHTHVGVPDGSEEILIRDLHSILCKNSGLSWHNKALAPSGPNAHADFPAADTSPTIGQTK